MLTILRKSSNPSNASTAECEHKRKHEAVEAIANKLKEIEENLKRVNKLAQFN